MLAFARDTDWAGVLGNRPARSRLRLGLTFSSGFDDENDFTVSALHVFSPVNDWQGEVRSFVSLGSSRTLQTEWWQPLSAGSPWFGAASAGYLGEAFDLYADGLRTAREESTSVSRLRLAGREHDRDRP